MEQISKTQKKKEALSLQALGEQLVTLSAEQLKKIDLPTDLSSAVTLAKKLKKHGARLRQMQYIGTLMRKYGPQPVQEALARREQENSVLSAGHKQCEQWRDELIAGNNALFEEILAKMPLSDRSELTGLVQKAREERAAHPSSPKAARALFRYLIKSAPPSGSSADAPIL